MNSNFSDIAVILPELLLAVMGMALLIWGAFRGNRDFHVITLTAAALMFAAAAVAIVSPTGGGFNNLFVNDAFSRFCKVVIFGAGGVSALMAVTFSSDTFRRFEMPGPDDLRRNRLVDHGFRADLMTVYLGIELSSLSAYVLAAMRRDNLRASEAGLKYFILGALSSVILLYGMSLVYGYTGGTSFEAVAAGIGGDASFGLIIGLVFLIAGLAFKISAAPFHMWTPDVYQGAPTPITRFPRHGIQDGCICAGDPCDDGTLCRHYRRMAADRHFAGDCFHGLGLIGRDVADQHQAHDGLLVHWSYGFRLGRRCCGQ